MREEEATMNTKKILLVDDEKGFTDVLRLNLESTGDYEVKVVNDAREAVKQTIAFRPNLILLDIIMPFLEGPDVVMALQENESIKNTPVVFLTATVTQEEVDQQQGIIGGHPFVAKPTNFEELVSSIEKNAGMVY